MDQKNKSEYFCPLPWISAGMRNNGDLRVCAHSNNSPNKGLSLKDDQSLFNARKDSFNSFRNSPLLKEIRKSMLNGEWHSNCVRCKDEVQSGVRARIKYETELRKDIINFEKAKSWTEPNGTIDEEVVPLSLLDIRFGNKCNLSCRTCNPTESDSWYEDHIALYGSQFKYDGQNLELKTSSSGRVQLDSHFFDWFEHEEFWNQFRKSLKDVTQIYCAGGEPLKVEAHIRMLREIIEAGYAHQISLEYNTNWYMIPEKVWEAWEYFKEVKIGVSIDSFGTMNDYIRYPSRWNIIEKNLALLDNQTDKYIVWFALTIHAYNIYYLPEIIQWRIKSNFKKINNFKNSILFSDHPVHNPKHLNIQMLPSHVKKAIALKFMNFKKTVPHLIKENDFMKLYPLEAESQVYKLLDSYADFMAAEDRSDLFPKFQSYTQKLDSIRKQNFAQTFPEFSQLLSDEKQINQNVF